MSPIVTLTSETWEFNISKLPWLDQKIYEVLNMDNGGSICFVLIVVLISSLVSGVIGFEREYRGHSAGLRTHMMVSIGATLIMAVSMIGFTVNNHVGDPFRLAAQVVSGIGFLGAGTIMQTTTDVKGLTTASTLWLCGGIGIACGAGFVSETLVVGAIVIIVLLFLGILETRYSKSNPKIVIINEVDRPILKTVLSIADKYDCYISNVQSVGINYRQKSCIKLIISFAKGVSLVQLKTFSEEVKEVVNPLEMKVNIFEKKKNNKKKKNK